MEVVSAVLPFRVNDYVVRNLINWQNVPDDPIFRMTFPQKDMLVEEHYLALSDTLKNFGENSDQFNSLVNKVRRELNPHPSGQFELNLPLVDGDQLNGLQHKYQKTVLYFPSNAQTCHSYCTFCFRWAQFIGDKSLRIASKEVESLFCYLKSNPYISDVLITGGDPMVMSAEKLEEIIEPLLSSEFEHVRNIRVGTKALTFWPYRFVSDPDSERLLRLFEKVNESGRRFALMAHLDHWQELESEVVEMAIRNINNTNTVIRGQAPILAKINDKPEILSRLWEKQVSLGIIPYYIFIERDTGAKNHFNVPLVQAYEIYKQAILRVSGLCRTARGPVMSSTHGKVMIEDVRYVAGHRSIVLKWIQSRYLEWDNRIFFAKYDEHATWFDQLQPLFEEDAHFFLVK
jgi:KamA family protein